MRTWKTPLLVGWLLSLAVAATSLATINFSPYTLSRGFTTDFVGDRATVTVVTQGSAAERAGILVGDTLQRDSARKTASKFLHLNDQLRFEITRNGRALAISFEPDHNEKTFEQRLADLHTALTTGVLLFASLFIILSNVRFTSSRWLVVALLVFSLGSIESTSNPDLYRLWVFISTPMFCFALALLLQFWISFAAEIGVPLSKAWEYIRRTAWTIAATLSVTFFLAIAKQELWGDTFREILKYLGDERWLDTVNSYQWWSYSTVLPILCIIVPIIIIRRSSGDLENHAYWIAATLLGFTIPWSIGQPTFFVLNRLGLIEHYGAMFDQLMGYLIWLIPVSLLLFCYVGVSQRMLSFKFAINQTAVYLATGGLLLIAYLMLKRNIETILPSDAETKKSAVNGVIAVLVFMTKQLRDLADAALKKFIFVDLKKRENKLSDFRARMSHFKTSAALHDATVAAISAFSHGANVKIFSINNGSFHDPLSREEIPLDDEIVITLRAGRASILNGVEAIANRWRIITPIFDRQELVGFVGVEYDPMLPTIRPDEARWVEKVVRQFGVQSALLELDYLRNSQKSLIATG